MGIAPPREPANSLELISALLRGNLPSFIHTVFHTLNPGTAYVSNWQCAPKARITSGGGFHPESCRLIW